MGTRAITQIEGQINKLKRSFIETKKRLLVFEQGPSNEQVANIIMANIHLIAEYATQVELYNFYNNTNITLKLKKDLTPQKNAEAYYRKAKNEKLEIEALNTKIVDFKVKIEQLIEVKQAIKDVKLLQKGKLKTIPAREALAKIKQEYFSFTL